MSSPYAPPPTETAAVVPPNRAAPRARTGWTVLVWLLLIGLVFAVYEGGKTRAERAADALERPAGQPLALLLPLLTYAGMVVGLLVVRRRLPARYRTGELRELSAPAPPLPDPAAPPPPPVDLTLLGRDDARPVRLHVDDAGLHWHSDARLLRPAQELHIAWPELEALTPFSTSSGLWSVLGVFGAIGAGVLLPDALRPLAALVVVAAVLVGMSGPLRRHGVVITTATHVLRFHLRARGSNLRDQLLAAARARSPRAIAAPTAGPSVWRSLFLEPFEQLAGLLRDDDAIHAAMGGTTVDAETTRAATTQWRLFALWNGVLRGVGPISAAIGVALASGRVALALAAGFGAWLFGLMVMTRSTVAFARFSGMSVIQPPRPEAPPP